MRIYVSISTEIGLHRSLVDHKKLSEVLNLKEATVKRHVKTLLAEKLIEQDEGLLFLEFDRKT